MTPPRTERSFARYLAAKRTVDDRSLNRHVWSVLGDSLVAPRDRPLRVLEVGAGIGTMVERVVEWGLLPDHTAYTAIDIDHRNSRAAAERLALWGERRTEIVAVTGAGSDRLRLESARGQLEVSLLTADIAGYATLPHLAGHFDLVIANAVIDLLNAAAALPLLLNLLRPGGLLYLPITFDGESIFEPLIDDSLDRRIAAAYHRTMDERTVAGQPSGDRRCGRHLAQRLRETGATLLALGSSDWVVAPLAGGYPDDEAFFLRYILRTVAVALRGRTEIRRRELMDWLAARRAQVTAGELLYVAHQLDALARRPE